MVAPRPPQTYEIQLNLANLHQGFSATLQTILDRVGLCLHSLRNLPESVPIDLPDVTSFHGINRGSVEAGNRSVSGDEREGLAKLSHNWIVGCGLRDTIEVLHHVLDETRRTCAIGELAPWQSVSAERYIEVTKPPKTWRQAGLPDRIKRLVLDYGPALDVDLSQEVLTINKLRGCLVHRLGVVAKQDCNEGDTLVVRWRRMALYALEAGGRRPIVLGTPSAFVSAGTEIQVVVWDKTARTFALGETVLLSPQEFSELTWTCVGFTMNLANGVEKYLRSKGMKFPDPPVAVAEAAPTAPSA